jgi:hypothetical protein
MKIEKFLSLHPEEAAKQKPGQPCKIQRIREMRAGFSVLGMLLIEQRQNPWEQPAKSRGARTTHHLHSRNSGYAYCTLR